MSMQETSGNGQTARNVSTRAAVQSRSELPRLEEMESLNRRIATLTRDPPPRDPSSDERSLLYSQRGALRSDLGIAEGGLLDCLRGHLGQLDADLPTLLETYRDHIQEYRYRPAIVHARTGEAIRVYVRDVLLSRVGGLSNAQGILESSIASFSNAIERLPQNTDPLIQRQKSWILAHRGAASVLKYWLSFIEDENDEGSFRAAQNDFQDAQAAAAPKRYDWCVQFEAFLLALHGQGDDFACARDRLAKLERHSVLDPAIHRSRAMLDTYIAADHTKPPELRKEAARVAIESGLTAARLDSEEHRALYYVAVARWQYMRLVAEDRAKAIQQASAAESNEQSQSAAHQKTPVDGQARDGHQPLDGQARDGHQPLDGQARDDDQNLEDLRQSIESARVRSQNQLSQTLTALVGLALLRGMTSRSEEERNEAFDSANRLSALWENMIPADLETQAMFARDPLFRTISLEKDKAVDCGRAWHAYKPNFHDLRARYRYGMRRTK